MGSAATRRVAFASLAVGAVGLALLGVTARGAAWRELAETALRAAFWLGVLVVAARIGAALTGSNLGGIPHLLWDGAAGLPVLIASWLVVGFIPGGFARAPILLVLAAFTAIAAVIAVRDPLSRGQDGVAEAGGGAAAVAAALFTGIVMLGLAWDRVPPVFFDTLAYHWAQPELWLVHGRIQPVTWSVHSWYPPGMSVLYGVGLAMGGERWASDANLLVGVMLLGLAWDLGRRRAGPMGGLAALALLATFPITIHALGIPAADLGHGLFTGGCLGALLVRAEADDAIWRRRAGLLAAGAVLTKFLGLLVPLALGAVWLSIGRSPEERSYPIRRRTRHAIAFVIPALVLVAPWLAADGVVTGNPVAPAAAGLLPPAGYAAGGAAAFQGDARGGWPTLQETRALGARLFYGEGADSPFYPVPAWGLMPLVLLLTLPLVRPGERGTDLLVVIGIVLCVWLATYRWERFLVGATFLIAVALGGMLAAAWRRGGLYRLAPILATVIALTATAASLDRVATFTGGGGVFEGREEPSAFFERSFASARVIRSVAGKLDPHARILFVGETRHYGSHVDRVAPTGFNVHPLVAILAGSADPAEERAEIAKRGFTHLMVDPGWIERSGRSYPSLRAVVSDPARFAALIRSLGTPIATDAGIALYAVTP